MNMQSLKSILKGFLCTAFVIGGVDSLFRGLNRDKLLVIMYHGVTARRYDPPVWTQLPVGIFRKQLDFIGRHYQVVGLADVVAAIKGNGSLPQNAALITFDDGLRNNYSVAFPVLREMGIPATIFLTVDFIGTERIFWFDELLFLIKRGYESKCNVPLPGEEARDSLAAGNIWDAYRLTVELLKRCGEEQRNIHMHELRSCVTVDILPLLEDFGLLDWHEVRIMHESGLVSFGTHTASHRILAELAQSEWEGEIARPRRTLEERLGTSVSSFCFPNGKPGMDFNDEHLRFLSLSGYECAFSTVSALFKPGDQNPLMIGRIPAGNDATSSMPLFRLNASGCIAACQEYLRGRRRMPGIESGRGSHDE